MDRQIKALQLRKDGVSYNEIARRLKFASTGAACNAVKSALKKAYNESVSELREVELARLDELWEEGLKVLRDTHLLINAGYPVKTGIKGKNLHDPDPKLRAIDTLVRISHRRAFLLGLDAPKVVGVVESSDKADWKRFITGALEGEDSKESDTNDGSDTNGS